MPYFLLKKIIFIIVILFGYCQYSSALFLDSIIYEMPANKHFISKRIYNDSGNAKLYNISAIKIANLESSEQDEKIKNGELVYGPLKFILKPNESEYFKLFYNGKEDNIERYFRLNYTEVELAKNIGNGKNIVPNTQVSISTILAVRPRNVNFKYQYDEATNQIKNTGNTYFRIIVNHNGEESPFYLLPNKTFQVKTKENTKIFIIYNQKYYLAKE